MLLASFAGFSYLYRSAYIREGVAVGVFMVSMTTNTCYNTMKMYETKIASWRTA